MHKLGPETSRQRLNRRPLNLSDPREVDRLFDGGPWRPVVDPLPTPNPWEALVLSILGILSIVCGWVGYQWWLSMGGM